MSTDMSVSVDPGSDGSNDILRACVPTVLFLGCFDSSLLQDFFLAYLFQLVFAKIDTLQALKLGALEDLLALTVQDIHSLTLPNVLI